jgi:hypothetical protein
MLTGRARIANSTGIAANASRISRERYMMWWVVNAADDDTPSIH